STKQWNLFFASTFCEDVRHVIVHGYVCDLNLLVLNGFADEVILNINMLGMCVVNSIYCSITVNHRLTGPGKMVKLCLLFVG
ncbi:hypothetical protein PILCRDRAFT_780276, partial [Piloderma croceum F 1598]